jgi:hypothetical protein
MFEHLHADNHVVVLAVLRRAQGIDRQKADVGQHAEALAASANLLGVDVGADRLGKRVVRQADERAITAAVIEQRAAGVPGGQLTGEREAASMAPGDSGVAAEDLLASVVPLPEQVS